VDFFATLLQWYFDPALQIPVVGASGAIAGVLAAYYFLYPLESVIVFFSSDCISSAGYRFFGFVGVVTIV